MSPESLRLTSEFPPETRRVLQVETWCRGKHLACSPLQSYPRQAEVTQALAPKAMAGRGHIYSLSVGAGSSSFFVSHPAAYSRNHKNTRTRSVQVS